MSGHSLSAVMLFFSVVAIGAAMQHADLNVATERRPAMERKEPIPPPSGVNLKYTHKIRGPVATTIELIGATPENIGDVFVLKGTVTSTDEVVDLDFKWAVPQGLEVINGLVSGTISVVKPGMPSEIQITLRNLEAENHQVHLITSGKRNNFSFAESTQYNTLLEPVLAASKEEMLKSTEKSLEDLREQQPKKHGDLKVFH